ARPRGKATQIRLPSAESRTECTGCRGGNPVETTVQVAAWSVEARSPSWVAAHHMLRPKAISFTTAVSGRVNGLAGADFARGDFAPRFAADAALAATRSPVRTQELRFSS